MRNHEKVLGAIGVLLLLYLFFKVKSTAVNASAYPTYGPNLSQLGASPTNDQVMQDANTPLTSGPSYFGGPVPQGM